MALQWMILSYIVAAEAVIALMLTVPLPKFVKSRVVSLVSAILPPLVSIAHIAASLATGRFFFSLVAVGIYWKNEHRLMCTGEACTASEKDRYEKSIYKAQRNAILCIAACLLYWFAYRICKYSKYIQDLEKKEKRYNTRKFRIWKKLRRGTRACRNLAQGCFYLIVLAVKFRIWKKLRRGTRACLYLAQGCFYLIVLAVKFRIWKKLRRGTSACRYLAQGCFYLIVLVVLP